MDLCKDYYLELEGTVHEVQEIHRTLSEPSPVGHSRGAEIHKFDQDDRNHVHNDDIYYWERQQEWEQQA